MLLQAALEGPERVVDRNPFDPVEGGSASAGRLFSIQAHAPFSTLDLRRDSTHCPPMQLANKWVLITGGSSGFGAAAAKAFGALGCHVLLGARRLDRLKDAAEAALAAGAASAHFHALDVASTPSVESFGQWLRTLTPRLDILINNAGGAHGLDTVANARDEDLEAMVQSNVLGVLRVTRCLIPLLPHHAGAWIINIGSIAGRTAYEGGAAYCGVKAAELKITQSLRLELNGTGIRVGTLDPGLAETEFSKVRFKGDQERARKVYEGTEPLVAQDIADALVFMATRPPHVCIDEMVIKPTDQAAIHKLYRRTK
jgi:3-hydroxy acid dehydrogenase/malonic semialdehyde reductase